jgi:hypothetical protein
MRIRVIVTLAAILAGWAGVLKAETAPAEPNPLESLAWMMGGKWTADGDKGPDGKPFHVEVKFNWTENHRGLKFTTWFLVGGKLVPVYEGLYAWHPVKKKFAFLYSDNEGNLTEGEAALIGDHLEQEFNIVSVKGTEKTFRSTIVHTAPDDYDWSVQRQNKDGAWVVMFGLKYKRQPA